MTAHPGSLPGSAPRGRPGPGRLLAGVTAGLVVGIIDIPVEISLAALVFSGALAGFVANGIGFFLFGARVLCGGGRTDELLPGYDRAAAGQPSGHPGSVGPVGKSHSR